MIEYKPIIQTISLSNGHRADVLRLDLLHPEISGNKWFKLKYSIQTAHEQGHHTILTFGGAFSNHIAATAAACKLFGLKSIGIIRGECPEEMNGTLIEAKKNGMQLHFISRDAYRHKDETDFKNELLQKFGKHYLIPEGGNTTEGLLGCKEILNEAWNYDTIFCACGTATTFAGLVAAANSRQTIVGISALKGENKLPADAARALATVFPGQAYSISGDEGLDNFRAGQHCITNAYCFSGYAKADKDLLDFKKTFEREQGLILDYIYTSKLFYAVHNLFQSGKIKPGSKALIIHSGGLQGNAGFENRYHLTPRL